MDTLTSNERSERMSRVRGKNTKPELFVRRMVHGLGYRYRLHAKELPGHPDLVFRPKRKAIFVHGCFWHRHPKSSCSLARLPKSRLSFWKTKLEGNRARDERNQKLLSDAGWSFLVVWECELRDKERLKNNLERFLGARQ